MGPGQLYQDLQNLLHDLNVVGQITQLIGDLKGHYQVTVGHLVSNSLFPSELLSACECFARQAVLEREPRFTIRSGWLYFLPVWTVGVGR